MSAKRITFEDARAFRLTIIPTTADMFGVKLEETYAADGHALASAVTNASASQTHRIIDTLLAAAKQSGHQGSVISISRKAPITLEESSGVRLALALLTTLPVSKHERVRSLVAGVNAMSTEETYYWYAKCLGPDAPRARKALRTLLSED